MFLKLFPLALIVVTVLVAASVYPHLPPLVATHWGINGQVDGYSSKMTITLLTPVLLIALYFLFLVLPHLKPYQKNFRQFSWYFDVFVCVVLSFLFYIYLLSLLWNLGYQFNMVQWLSPGFALVWYFTGVLTSHARPNWFVGIRTPWTMSSPVVWHQTHQLGGRLFKISALLSLFTVVAPSYGLYFMLFPILISAVTLFAYSYWLYRQL